MIQLVAWKDSRLVNLTRVDRPSHSNGYPVRPTIMVCPMCTDKWAKFELSSEAGPYDILPVSCEICAYQSIMSPIPGSLITNWSLGQGENGVDWELLEVLPEQLLRREFDLTLKYLGDSDGT